MTAPTSHQVSAEYRWMQLRGHTREEAVRELGMREDAFDRALARAGHQDVVEAAAVNSRWRDRAACLDADPELFSPVDVHRPDTFDNARDTARRFCSRCPVVAECGRDADSRRHQGLWGAAWRTAQPSYHRLPLLPGLVLEPLGERRRRS